MSTSVSRMRRRVRRALRFQKWPLRRRIAVVAWAPVLLLWFVLYTGPNSAANSAPLKATTTTTEWAPPLSAPTTAPKKVPDNALLLGALPDITPRMPPIVSDQYRLLIEQASKIQTAEKRPSAPVVRELERIQASATAFAAAGRGSKTRNDSSRGEAGTAPAVGMMS